MKPHDEARTFRTTLRDVKNDNLVNIMLDLHDKRKFVLHEITVR